MSMRGISVVARRRILSIEFHQEDSNKPRTRLRRLLNRMRTRRRGYVLIGCVAVTCLLLSISVTSLSRAGILMTAQTFTPPWYGSYAAYGSQNPPVCGNVVYGFSHGVVAVVSVSTGQVLGMQDDFVKHDSCLPNQASGTSGEGFWTNTFTFTGTTGTHQMTATWLVSVNDTAYDGLCTGSNIGAAWTWAEVNLGIWDFTKGQNVAALNGNIIGSTIADTNGTYCWANQAIGAQLVHTETTNYQWTTAMNAYLTHGDSLQARATFVAYAQAVCETSGCTVAEAEIDSAQTYTSNYQLCNCLYDVYLQQIQIS